MPFELEVGSGIETRPIIVNEINHISSTNKMDHMSIRMSTNAISFSSYTCVRILALDIPSEIQFVNLYN